VDLTAAEGGAQNMALQLDVADSHQGNPPVATADFINVDTSIWPGNTVDDVLLLEGTVQSNVFVESALSGTQALGKATLFLSVDPTKGKWGFSLNSDWFVSEFGDAADMRIDWVIEGPYDYGTTDKGAGFIRSNDEGGTAVVIPEPLTMLSIFLGVSGLGGYIRRRMAA
jgi:hypothetical protein